MGYEEVKKYVEELRSITAEMSRVLGDMSGGLKPPLMTERDRGVPMDVDDAGSCPPLSTAVVIAGELVPSHEELEYVLDRVVELEGTLLNIRNDLDARYDEFEERMEEFRAAVEEKKEGGGAEEEEGGESVAVVMKENPMWRMVKSARRTAKDNNASLRVDLDM